MAAWFILEELLPVCAAHESPSSMRLIYRTTLYMGLFISQECHQKEAYYYEGLLKHIRKYLN